MEEVKGTILIVDDEESIGNIICRRLGEEGYACEVAADGKEALWKAFVKDFDLVLMDIKMPGMSGMETLPQIVTNHPDTCVIMMTAVVDTETAVEAMKLGAYDYVTKPFDLDDLSMRMGKALEKRKLTLENREYQRLLEQKVKQHVEQMQQYYQESVEALTREQIALEELHNARTAQPALAGDASIGAGVTVKSKEASPVREFARKLSQLFGRGTTSDSLNEENASAAVQKESATKGTNDNLALQNDVVELTISPAVNLEQIMQFQNRLKSIRQLKVLDINGSVEKDVIMRLSLENPVPLVDILKTMPEIEKVAETIEEGNRMPSSSAKEPSRKRKIQIKLSKTLAKYGNMAS
ncbi:MAG: sigma-54-dependent Fis family transcriptional regulator [Chloroflexi bacterium]|nr:sigma-54-dependent Fis family transcriptional regulator [Chloroflexota bacterium]